MKLGMEAQMLNNMRGMLAMADLRGSEAMPFMMIDQFLMREAAGEEVKWTEEMVKNSLAFLERCNLKGEQVPVFMNIVGLLKQWLVTGGKPVGKQAPAKPKAVVEEVKAND